MCDGQNTINILTSYQNMKTLFFFIALLNAHLAIASSASAATTVSLASVEKIKDEHEFHDTLTIAKLQKLGLLNQSKSAQITRQFRVCFSNDSKKVTCLCLEELFPDGTANITLYNYRFTLADVQPKYGYTSVNMFECSTYNPTTKDLKKFQLSGQEISDFDSFARQALNQIKKNPKLTAQAIATAQSKNSNIHPSLEFPILPKKVRSSCLPCG